MCSTAKGIVTEMISEYTPWILYAPAGQAVVLTNELRRSEGLSYYDPSVINEVFQRTFKYNKSKDTCKVLDPTIAEFLELDEDIPGSYHRWLNLFSLEPIGSLMLWQHLSTYEVGIYYDHNIYWRNPPESFRIPNIIALEMGLCTKLDEPEPSCLCNRLDAKNIAWPQVVSTIAQGNYYRAHDLLYPSHIVAYGKLIYSGITDA